MFTPIQIAGFGLAAITALKLLQSEEETEFSGQKNSFSPETRPEPRRERPKVMVRTRTVYPKRGERFTDSETGEQLQVRAVGGRPRKTLS